MRKRRLVRRELGLTWVLAAGLVAAGLAAATIAVHASAIQDTVLTGAEASLRTKGLNKVEVRVQGRTVQARVPTGVSRQKVRQVLQGVPGAESVSTVGTYASPAEAAACTSLSKRLNDVTDAQRITFVGQSATITAEGRAMVMRAATAIASCPSTQITVGGYADRGTPSGAQISLGRAEAIAALLQGAGIATGKLTVLGYGDQFPASTGNSLAERQQNERGSIDVRGTA